MRASWNVFRIAVAGLAVAMSSWAEESGKMAARQPTAYDLWTVAEKAVVHPRVDKGPGLVRAANGDVLALFGPPHGSEHFGATAEQRAGLPPGRLLVSRSRDGGLTWSEAMEVPPPAGREIHIGDPCPALRLTGGRILTVVRACAPGAAGNDIYFSEHLVCYSDDDGVSWQYTAPIDLSAIVGGHGYAGGPLTEIDGEVILGFQGALSEEERRRKTYSAVLFRSRDAGLSWDGPTIILRPAGHCTLAAEPVVTKLADGRWIAYVRYHEPSNPRIVNLTRHESRDGGRTWSGPEHVGQGAQAHVANLPGGGLVMTATDWNGIEARFSYDGGWSFTRTLLFFDPWSEGSMPGNDGGFWNQSLLVLDDDTILCGWTGVAVDDAHKTVPYPVREPRWGLAARIAVLRRQRGRTHGVPDQAAGR